MPTVMVKDTDIIPASIDGDGAIPAVGDILDIGVGDKHRGLWRVVEREYRVTGPRCVLSFVYVQPVDERAIAYCSKGDP